MKKLRDKCSKTGALLILDEIQTGFGRTGKMFAFEHYSIVPDILTLAKALGGGMPIGAFISSKEIMAKLSYDPMLGHITTFGGHPVSCAAAAANIGVLLDEKLIDPVEQKGALLQELLDHPKINEIRRIGLMLALEFDSRETVEKIVKGCMENGVICFWFLSCPESFRLSPPLTISEEEMEIAALVIKQEIESHT
jgi:acetylornithine/succinyldiaminopimelate/putrescine aminotransferase